MTSLWVLITLFTNLYYYDNSQFVDGNIPEGPSGLQVDTSNDINCQGTWKDITQKLMTDLNKWQNWVLFSIFSDDGFQDRSNILCSSAILAINVDDIVGSGRFITFLHSTILYLVGIIDVRSEFTFLYLTIYFFYQMLSLQLLLCTLHWLRLWLHENLQQPHVSQKRVIPISYSYLLKHVRK